MMLSFGPNEVLIIFILVALLFGASKIPEVARNMGRAIGEFKKGQKESELEIKQLEEQIKS